MTTPHTFKRLAAAALALGTALLATPTAAHATTQKSFDLIIQADTLGNHKSDPRAFIVKDLQAGNPSADRTWAVAQLATEKGSVAIRVLTVVANEPSGRIQSKGFYRVSGTTKAEQRCVSDSSGCEPYFFLEITSAAKVQSGDCTRSDEVRGAQWVTVCSYSGGLFVWIPRYRHAHFPAQVLLVEAKIAYPRRTVTLRPNQSFPQSLKDGPAQLPVVTPGSARCEVKVTFLIDRKDDGKGATSRANKFSLNC